MAEGDIVMVRQRELKRLHVIRKVMEGTLTQRDAAGLMSLSERQIRRIVARIREEGDEGIRHRSRGRPSKRKLPFKERIVQLYRSTYPDFGPTLFTEKLEEREGIVISRETVRTWLMEEGEWKKHRKHKAHRQWRQRKDCYGEMLQMDGSHHDWFEGRGPHCVLMAYSDDATGRAYGRFYDYEGTIPAMDSFTRYITKHGVPMSVYLDKHTTYKSWARRDEFQEIEPVSQFGRALKELGVRMLHAHSPQAKGRIERLFQTLQDRLVKEMRLRNVSTIPEANRFLASYLPVYNRRFSVPPKKNEDLHRMVKDVDLDTILCIKTERTLKNDHTIQYNGTLYQIQDRIHAKKVMVEELIDGCMRIRHKGVPLSFHEIVKRPAAPEKERPFIAKGKGHRPPIDHGWRPPWFKQSRREDYGTATGAS
ncbi:MAG TPA: ISNCY family transposase [Syntrophorhabdales bacterium]|nr:ISNCY family transposase [Syntrophorhabdales bacterium]